MKKYHCPGGQNYIKRAKNAVFISSANTLQHEMAKLETGWLLKKEGMDFITECVSNKDNRRVDLVILDTGDEVEFETTKARAARFKDMEVILVKLWEKKPVKNYLKDVLG